MRQLPTFSSSRPPEQTGIPDATSACPECKKVTYITFTHISRGLTGLVQSGLATILGRLSKRGNGYLRMLFIQAARVILLRPANCPKPTFFSRLGEAFLAARC
jgi:hypothetical protein